MTDKKVKAITFVSPTPEDIDTIIGFIHGIAKYEKMENEVFLKKTFFTNIFLKRPAAEVLMLERKQRSRLCPFLP